MTFARIMLKDVTSSGPIRLRPSSSSGSSSVSLRAFVDYLALFGSGPSGLWISQARRNDVRESRNVNRTWNRKVEGENLGDDHILLA